MLSAVAAAAAHQPNLAGVWLVTLGVFGSGVGGGALLTGVSRRRAARRPIYYGLAVYFRWALIPGIAALIIGIIILAITAH